MSDVFGISISALQAYQTALAVTSNNIANANTPGYAKESIDLTAAVPQTDGSAPIGAGVQVASISRAFSQLAENQLNTSQSSLGQLNSLQTYTNQVDNIIGTTDGEVGGIVKLSVRSVIGDDLKAVVFRHINRLPHCPVHHVSDFETIFRGLSLAQVDPNERHNRIIPSDAGHGQIAQIYP